MKSREDASFSMKNSADLDFSINVQKNTTTSKEKIRQTFDNISLNVISFLEKHRGVTDVKFFERPPITENQIIDWENKYFPCKLPNDYKSFLYISDGFLLKWHMKYNREVLPLGNMSLSPLQLLKPIEFDNNNKDKIAFVLNNDNNNNNNNNNNDSSSSSSTIDGKVVIVFDISNKTNISSLSSSIWFQDLSCEWNFICTSFSDYFRLMIMHLGLKGWQYSFTKIGLNPITMQWLRFLVPNRLDIDLRHNANGFGWILPNKSLKNKKNENAKLKRKKLNLNKIDQIVSSQLAKDNVNNNNKQKNIKLDLTNNNNDDNNNNKKKVNQQRPGSAPNNNNNNNNRKPKIY